MKPSDLLFGGLLVAAIASAPSCESMNDAAIAKCESMSAAERRCTLDAKTLEDLQRCTKP